MRCKSLWLVIKHDRETCFICVNKYYYILFLLIQAVSNQLLFVRIRAYFILCFTFQTRVSTLFKLKTDQIRFMIGFPFDRSIGRSETIGITGIQSISQLCLFYCALQRPYKWLYQCSSVQVPNAMPLLVAINTWSSGMSIKDFLMTMFV